MVVRFVATRLVPAAATLGVAITVYSSPAAAFFPPIGSEPPPVVVVPPPVSPQVPLPPPVVVPPVVPPPFVPPPIPPTVPPPVVPNDRCPDPQEIPEPGTIALAAIGLGVAGTAGLKKFRKKKDVKRVRFAAEVPPPPGVG
jgi:hypothetical protein